MRQNAWNENGQENVSFAMKSLHQACVLRMLYDETVKENTFLSRSHASISLDCSEITGFFGRYFWRVFENNYGLLRNSFIKEYIMLYIILSFNGSENAENMFFLVTCWYIRILHKDIFISNVYKCNFGYRIKTLRL